MASGLSCSGQQTVLVGQTALEDGFYQTVFTVVILAAFVAILAFGLNALGNRRTQTIDWALMTANVLIALSLAAVCAVPWAYYNVGHPLSDRVYQVRNVVAPQTYYVEPGSVRRIAVDPTVWQCENGPCEGDPRDTKSQYRHVQTGLSYRFVFYSECMPPQFNIAAAQAIGAAEPKFGGDRRRTARAFFDQEGRFIGPRDAWFATPLMWAQLSTTEKEPASISFDRAMTLLAQSSANPEILPLPIWADWNRLGSFIATGDVATIHKTDGLLVGLKLKDGREFIGTMAQSGDLDRALKKCGAKCDHIDLEPRD